MRAEKKTDEELKGHQSLFEKLALWSGIAVVAGLGLEVWLAVEFRPRGEPFIHVWGTVFADVLVAVGVFFEIMFGRWALHQGAELQQRAEKLLSAANERAAKLEKEAADSRGRVADIERLTAWRRVSDEQTAQIATSLGHMAADLDLLVEYDNSDKESWAYSLEITKVFVTAGVTKIRRIGNSFPGEIVFGIHMWASPGVNVAFIASEFGKAHVIAQVNKGKDLSTHLSRSEVPPNLYVFVGPKPLPAFEDWVKFNAERSIAPQSSATRE